MNDCIIGIDLGGTNIKAGVVGLDHAVLTHRSVETQAGGGFEHVFGRIVDLCRELLDWAVAGGHRVTAAGIGAPGPMVHKTGVVISAPNLPGWNNVPIRDRLSAAINLPATLENDANAAAYGEYLAVASGGVRDMVMLTLGTGIGGGVILAGQLWRGSFDNAGEVGHTIVVPDGRPCPCGQRGCLERYASAHAVGVRCGEALAAGAESNLRSVWQARGEVTAKEVQEAAQGGDALAARIWDETCVYLAIACVNLQHVLNPQLIVLAGGLIAAGDALLAPVRRHFAERTWKAAQDAPRIELARLGGDAGIIGAAALAQIAA